MCEHEFLGWIIIKIDRHRQWKTIYKIESSSMRNQTEKEKKKEIALCRIFYLWIYRTCWLNFLLSFFFLSSVYSQLAVQFSCYFVCTCCWFKQLFFFFIQTASLSFRMAHKILASFFCLTSNANFSLCVCVCMNVLLLQEIASAQEKKKIHETMAPYVPLVQWHWHNKNSYSTWIMI